MRNNLHVRKRIGFTDVAASKSLLETGRIAFGKRRQIIRVELRGRMREQRIVERYLRNCGSDRSTSVPLTVRR